TDWPIERISEVVQPTAAHRPALDELQAASAKAIEMLKSGCPKDLPSIPTGRLAAMEGRLQVMLAAVQTVRPALERFYQSLSDECVGFSGPGRRQHQCAGYHDCR